MLCYECVCHGQILEGVLCAVEIDVCQCIVCVVWQCLDDGDVSVIGTPGVHHTDTELLGIADVYDVCFCVLAACCLCNAYYLTGCIHYGDSYLAFLQWFAEGDVVVYIVEVVYTGNTVLGGWNIGVSFGCGHEP